MHGIVRRTSSFATGRIDHLRKGFAPGSDGLQLHYGDLGDGTGLRRIIEQVRPDEVYNLAAQSHVRISFDQPEYTADVVGLGTLRLLEAMRDHNHRHGRSARLYQAGSSEMFGKVAEIPQRETTPFHPRSPYACAKVYAHRADGELPRGLRTVCRATASSSTTNPAPRRKLRDPQNHPQRRTRIKLGMQKKLALGNLDAKRDWGFAGDYVEAMWLMLQQEQARRLRGGDRRDSSGPRVSRRSRSIG